MKFSKSMREKGESMISILYIISTPTNEECFLILGGTNCCLTSYATNRRHITSISLQARGRCLARAMSAGSLE